MSAPKTTPSTGATPEGDADPTRTAFAQRYAGQSTLAGDSDRLALFADLDRDPVKAEARVTDPVALREALSALYAVVQSDFRYKPKDRTALMAYRRMRQQSATLSAWAAQKAYFDWLSRNDPLAWMVLDPVVTVQPDAVIFEVFSKDEGSYAQLTVDAKALEFDGTPTYGTTNVDFSKTLFDGVQRMRSYRDTRLSIGRDAVALETDDAEVVEKRIQVPDAWLRGFLQVQSAATLAETSFSLAPVDLYNALRHLRLNGDTRRGGRAVRVELVPGENPRLVLEPWETVIETSKGVYAGRTPQVVRIWGRRRLMMLRRFLPFVDSIDVHLLGSGLPGFWVLRAGPLTFTLGLTGFTSANWSRSLTFDVLLPRPDGAEDGRTAVLDWLKANWLGKAAAIAKATSLKPADARSVLQALCQEGLVMFDLARDVFRLRPLSAEPIDPARLAFRNPRERDAHDLLAKKDAVKLVKENRIYGQGIELTGKVNVASEKREYRPQMLVGGEGRVRKAECTCKFYRANKLKEGPCAHIYAVRLAHARLEAKRAAQRGGGRSTVTVETRTYSRRKGANEAIYQLGLDRTRLRIRWGNRGDASLRLQQLVFDTPADARSAYFARIDDLEASGFLDATAG